MEDEHLFVVGYDQELASTGKADLLHVFDFIAVELAEFFVEEVIHSDLVSEGNRHIIPTWMQARGQEWSLPNQAG